MICFPDEKNRGAEILITTRTKKTLKGSMLIIRYRKDLNINAYA